MQEEIEILKASDDKIKIISNGKEFRPYDELSYIKIGFEIDYELAEEFPDNDDPGYLLLIRRIYGSVIIGDDDPSLTFLANIDTLKAKGWKISSSRVKRISNIIFPHEVVIDFDKKEIHVLFNVY